MEALDCLTLKGFGRADGDYRFDLFSLIEIGGHDALTSQEQHRIKQTAGVRGAEVFDAVVSLDAATMVALAGIILARAGRTIPEQRIWNTRMVYASEPYDLAGYTDAILWQIADRETVEQDEEAEQEVPPSEVPPPDETQSRSGGTRLSLTSALQENGQSRTGSLSSATAAPSDRVTSVG